MGRKPKNPLTNIPTDKSELFNLPYSLHQMAVSAKQAKHVKESTIQAAGLREIIPSIQGGAENEDG